MRTRGRAVTENRQGAGVSARPVYRARLGRAFCRTNRRARETAERRKSAVHRQPEPAVMHWRSRSAPERKSSFFASTKTRSVSSWPRQKQRDQRTDAVSPAALDNLDLPDNQFDLVVGNASLVSPRRVRKMFSEMVRVAGTGRDDRARVADRVQLRRVLFDLLGSFAQHGPDGSRIGRRTVDHRTAHGVGRRADGGRRRTERRDAWTRIEEFDYESGEQFLNSPLVSEFLMPAWLALVPEDMRAELFHEISRLINEERHEAEFALSVKATLVVGQKAHSH